MLEVFQYDFGPVLPLGLAVNGRDGHHQPRGVGERRDIHDVQVPQHAVAAIGEDLVERDGHLPAELAGLAVDRPALRPEAEARSGPGPRRLRPP